MLGLGLLPMLCTDAMAHIVSVTATQVQNAISGGQNYLVAQQVAPVFGTTGQISAAFTSSNFPSGQGPQVGDTYYPYVDLSTQDVMVLSGPTGFDNINTYNISIKGTANGVVGTWQIVSNSVTQTLTIANNGTFTFTKSSGGTTYTAAGTYTYNSNVQYLVSGGYWTDSYQGRPVASTGFAVAALLDSGIDLTQPANQTAVKAGIMYILQHVDDVTTDASFGGIYDTSNYSDANYTNGICLAALCLYAQNNATTIAALKNVDFTTIIRKSVAYVMRAQNLNYTAATNRA
jgi:hypothetical protein